jgi:hypothetical protein
VSGIGGRGSGVGDRGAGCRYPVSGSGCGVWSSELEVEFGVPGIPPTAVGGSFKPSLQASPLDRFFKSHPLPVGGIPGTRGVPS